MKRILDIDSWARLDHFNFFNQFDEPFFGVCIDVDCTKAYEKCKKSDNSFFLYYIHKSLIAANNIEPFRYRIENKQVVVYDRIHASPTIIREDETFGFSLMEYNDDFEIFSTKAKVEIEKIRKCKGLLNGIIGNDIIHYSSLPWIKFNSISHARNFKTQDTCPKITFGKIFDQENIKKIPISVHVHHALVDGIHVGKFLDEFQNQMNL